MFRSQLILHSFRTPVHFLEHSNSGKKSFDSIRFGNLINLPLVHWYSNSKLGVIFIVCIAQLFFCRCSINAANNDSLFWLRLYTKSARKAAWQLVNRKADFFNKTNRFQSICITNRIESIRIANLNALLVSRPTYYFSRNAETKGLFTAHELQ